MATPQSGQRLPAPLIEARPDWAVELTTRSLPLRSRMKLGNQHRFDD